MRCVRGEDRCLNLPASGDQPFSMIEQSAAEPIAGTKLPQCLCRGDEVTLDAVIVVGCGIDEGSDARQLATQVWRDVPVRTGGHDCQQFLGACNAAGGQGVIDAGEPEVGKSATDAYSHCCARSCAPE